jgi:hypothetical protein
MAEFYKVTGTNVVKGAGRLLVADTATTFPTEIDEVIALADEVGPPAVDIYDAREDWTDVGATFGGITITRGFDTEGFSVDQVNGDLGEDITGWTNTIETALAETSLANFDLAWIGGTATVNSAPSTLEEEVLTFGDPANVPQKKLAIAFMSRYDLIRMYAFRLVQRAGDDSALVHEKGGDPMTLPILFRAFPDTSVEDRDGRIFTIFQQIPA